MAGRHVLLSMTFGKQLLGRQRSELPRSGLVGQPRISNYSRPPSRELSTSLAELPCRGELSVGQDNYCNRQLKGLHTKFLYHSMNHSGFALHGRLGSIGTCVRISLVLREREWVE